MLRTMLKKSGAVVNDAMAAMNRIEDATDEIGKIINVIDEIAFQTNLLALNAGVELHAPVTLARALPSSLRKSALSPVGPPKRHAISRPRDPVQRRSAQRRRSGHRHG